MIVLIPYINLLNLSWIIKCLFLSNMEPLKISKFFSFSYLVYLFQTYFVYHPEINKYSLNMSENMSANMSANTHELSIVSDKALAFFNWKLWIFFLFLHENMCCGYSLEVPHQGASNEYPHHNIFVQKYEKNILNTPSYLELWTQHEKMYLKTCASSKNTGQAVHPLSS